MIQRELHTTGWESAFEALERAKQEGLSAYIEGNTHGSGWAVVILDDQDNEIGYYV